MLGSYMSLKKFSPVILRSPAYIHTKYTDYTSASTAFLVKRK